MITKYPDGSFRLNIFDRFEIDYDLKKHKNKEQEKTSDGYVASQNRVGSFIVSSSGTSQASDVVSFTSIQGQFNGENTRESLFSMIKRNISKLFAKTKTKLQEVSVKTVFETIISNQKELEHLKIEAEKITSIMNKAKEMGQIALYEKLKKELPIKLLEEKLFFNGFTKYISEQDVIKFSKNSERGLKLAFIKNFIRNVPSEVQALKIKADVLEVFDNYAVMFYDPENKGTAMTEKEIEKAKDPILFGLIRNSDKLYFVGDWKDELCDLTFDEMLLKLAEQKTEPIKETIKNETTK